MRRNITLLLTMTLVSSLRAGDVHRAGQTSSIRLEVPVSGHLGQLNGKYKLRATETIYEPNGFIGEHHHAGPGIRYVAEGVLTYIQGTKTTIYHAGDYFFEAGDISHTAVNQTAKRVRIINFEVLPISFSGSSAIPVPSGVSDHK